MHASAASHRRTFGRCGATPDPPHVVVVDRVLQTVAADRALGAQRERGLHLLLPSLPTGVEGFTIDAWLDASGLLHPPFRGQGEHLNRHRAEASPRRFARDIAAKSPHFGAAAPIAG